MFYTIPKKMQEQVVDLFCNTRLKVQNIINLVDPYQSIPVTEFYKFLEEYRDENGNKVQRIHGKTKEEYKDIVKNMKLENRKNKGLENKKEKERAKSKSDKKSAKKGVTYARIYDSKIIELDEKGLSLAQIRGYFLKFGIDVFEEINVGEDNKVRYFRKMDNKLEDIIRTMKKEGVSLRDISGYLKAKGIMVSHESVRRICRMTPEEAKKEENVIETSKLKEEQEEIER